MAWLGGAIHLKPGFSCLMKFKVTTLYFNDLSFIIHGEWDGSNMEG